MSNSVQLIEKDTNYVVRLSENGKVLDKSFDARAYAISFATSQAIRLKCTVNVAPVGGRRITLQ